MGLVEGVNNRLWPLEEIMLSDRIQFVNCESEPIEEGHINETYDQSQNIAAVAHFCSVSKLCPESGLKLRSLQNRRLNFSQHLSQMEPCLAFCQTTSDLFQV